MGRLSSITIFIDRQSNAGWRVLRERRDCIKPKGPDWTGPHRLWEEKPLLYSTSTHFTS